MTFTTFAYERVFRPGITSNLTQGSLYDNLMNFQDNFFSSKWRLSEAKVLINH